ncbi:hypothetical protein BDR22DRAFT_851776 [Usnea florida]
MARASPALRDLIHALSRSSTIISAFRAPAIAQDRTTSRQFSWLETRRHASVNLSQYLTENGNNSHIRGKRHLPPDVESLVSSPRRLEPAAWVATIEAYLPLALRLEKENIVGEKIEHGVLRPIYTLPEVLSLARSSCRTDLLTYIGIYQERWKAVNWLVKAMMAKYSAYREVEKRSSQLPSPSWQRIDQSLDEVTSNAIKTETPQLLDLSTERNGWCGHSSLDQYTEPDKLERWDHPQTLGRKSLGQIWRSLATMILQAADRPAKDPSYSVIMSHVFQILGHLHRIGAIPDSIYNYAPPIDHTALQRPPTLHLLSKRIMSTLSDVEWGLQWEKIIAQATSQGYDLPEPSVQPEIREFGPELWLDLVLWACVEGGWISEGAWVIIEIEGRSKSKDSRWSTISWPEICEMKAPQLDWPSILRLEIDKARLNQVGGIGIAAGSNSHVEMGTRTISREVVLALMDGLFNGPQSATTGIDMTPVELRRSIIACKSLLARNHADHDSHCIDAAILRIFESVEDVKEHPEMLNRFLDLRSTEIMVTRKSGTKIAAQHQEMDHCAAVLGLRHRILHRFSADGNLQGSLQTLRKIQSTIDLQYEGRILTFVDELKERLEKGDDCSDLVGEGDDPAALIRPPQVPPDVLASFIDLTTNCRLFDLGNWLLSNGDVDGGLVDPALYSNQNLQPALLRFGTATADSRLLTEILVRLETPLSEPIIHALLRFQVVLGKWTAVEELLEHLKNEPGMAWKPSDATTIAKAILALDERVSNNTNPDSIPRALALLQNLVNGKYNSKSDPSQLRPDFSQMRMANQLGRLLQTLPGSLSEITTRPAGDDLRAHASVEVTSNAFNIILEGLVDCYGSHAGKRLWDQWCHAPNTRKQNPPFYRSLGDGERVVHPSRYMLRSVLRPVLETRQALHAAIKAEIIEAQQESKAATSDNQGEASFKADAEKFKLKDEDQEVLAWGISMYRKFGLSESEINIEIPGSFPQQRRAKPVQDEDAL